MRMPRNRGPDPRVKRRGLVKDNRAGVPDGQRRCVQCREAKPADSIHFGTRDGGKYLTSWCRDCQRRSARERIAARRADPDTAAVVAGAKARYAKSDKGRQWRRSRGPVENNLRRQRDSARPFCWTDEDWQRCKQAWGDRCAYCGRGPKLEQDHFIAISSPDFPGTVVWNIVPACGRCNRVKGARDPYRWAEPFRLAHIVLYLLSVGMPML